MRFTTLKLQAISNKKLALRIELQAGRFQGLGSSTFQGNESQAGRGLAGLLCQKFRDLSTRTSLWGANSSSVQVMLFPARFLFFLVLDLNRKFTIAL